MQAKDRKIKELLDGKFTTFLIPPYQRLYTWKYSDQVKELLDDIDKFIFDLEKNIKTSYFLGSIVIKSDSSGGNTNNILVDGQQRITTFLIILSALNYIIPNDSDIKPQIKSLLEAEEGKFKLSKIDSEKIMEKILKNKIGELDEIEKETNYYKVFENLVLFFKKFNSKEIERFYYKGLTKIDLAVIYLDEKEDEFLVFESINSKGTALKSSDLIKSFIMMKLQNDELEQKFENEILKKLPKNEVDDFYRQLIAILTGKLVSKTGKGMYYVFREIFSDKDINEDFIKMLKLNTKIWRYIHDEYFGFESYPFLKSALLNYYSIAHAFILNNSTLENELLNVNKEVVKKAFKIISSIWIRRTLALRGRVESNRKFASLSKKVFDEKIEIEKVDEILSSESGQSKTPSWKEVRENAETLNLYSEHSNAIKWILIALEESMSKKEINHSALSIEHIFPQNPNEDWKLALKLEERNEIIEKYLHSLGNISITNENSAMGNKYITGKNKVLEDRSYLKINKFVYNQKKWGIAEIKNRYNILIKMIEEIWT